MMQAPVFGLSLMTSLDNEIDQEGESLAIAHYKQISAYT